MNLLMRLLPVPLRDDPLLNAISEALYSPFELWHAWIDTRGRQLAVSSLPESWLDFVLHISGWPPMPTRSADQKRAVLLLGVEWWAGSGTKESSEAYLQAITEISSRIYTVGTEPLFPSPWLYPRPDLYPSDGLHTWEFIVEVPVDSIEEPELRRLLDPVLPRFAFYTVVYV